MRRNRGTILGLAATLVGATLAGVLLWGVNQYAAGSTSEPVRLNAAPAAALVSAGILLGPPARDPAWCQLPQQLGHGRTAVQATRLCPVPPSETAAERTLRQMRPPNRAIRESALADCSVPLAAISHQLCWVLVVSTPPIGGRYLVTPAKGVTRGTVKYLDFVDARRNTYMGTAVVFVPAAGTVPVIGSG